MSPPLPDEFPLSPPDDPLPDLLASLPFELRDDERSMRVVLYFGVRVEESRSRFAERYLAWETEGYDASASLEQGQWYAAAFVRGAAFAFGRGTLRLRPDESITSFFTRTRQRLPP